MDLGDSCGLLDSSCLETFRALETFKTLRGLLETLGGSWRLLEGSWRLLEGFWKLLHGCLMETLGWRALGECGLWENLDKVDKGLEYVGFILLCESQRGEI